MPTTHSPRQRAISQARASAAAERNRATVVLSSDNRVLATVKISDPAARRDLQALRRDIRNPNEAAALLREAGIATPQGRLSRRFGG
jgi:hypothetical protein